MGPPLLPYRGCRTSAVPGLRAGASVTSDDDENENDSASSSSSSSSCDTGNRHAAVLPPETSPLPPHTFAGMVEAALYDQFFVTPSHDDEDDDDHNDAASTDTNTNTPRVIQSWRLLERGYEHNECVGVTKLGRNDATSTQCYQQCHSYVPGLTVREFWDPIAFDWCTKLQSKHPAILKEFQTVTADLQTLQQHGNNIWAGALTDDASSYGKGWKTLVLMDRGRWDPINVNLFPITSQAVYNSGVPAVEVFFASMEPHTTIQPHSDFTNFVLTSHLPLIVPYSGQNMCRLTIGDTTQQWINGKLLLFDTSLLHSAINDSDQTRYILMLRLWHPDLSLTEQAALQFTYDCLEDPELLSSDVDVRLKAQQRAEAQRTFPQLVKGTTVKQGFGGKSFGSGASKKRKSRR